MAAALQRLGFDVTTELDTDRVELTEALRRFTQRSAGADVSLVFYAGHGIEMDGVNYNPLAGLMQRTAATRTVSGGSFADLNEDLLGDETLVAYAAAAGTTSADGLGRHSPYTGALLTHLETPLEIGLLFRRVRAQGARGARRRVPCARVPLAGERALPEADTSGGRVGHGERRSARGAGAGRPSATRSGGDGRHGAARRLRELAGAGDAAAQTELGERYEHALGVEQDHGVAASWFRRAELPP